MKQRTKKIKPVLAFILLVLLANSAVGLDQWSQWRGPGRDGMAKNVFPRTWPDSLSKKWEIKIGPGHSSPIVWNDRVYTFTREGEEEVVRSIDIASGRIVWRSAYAAPYKIYPGAAGFGLGPRSTPVIWGKRLFTLGISGLLSAFDIQSGELRWQKKFDQQFPEAVPPFGASMSPLVAGNLLIAHVGGHKGGSLTAFDVETGDEKWNLRGEGPSYSSPIVLELHGTDQVVIQAHRKIMGVEVATGTLLWSIPFVTPCDQNIVTPLLAGDLLIFSSLDTGTYAVRVEKKPGAWTTQKVWENQDVSMYMSSPIYIDGMIVGMSHKKQGQFFGLDSKSGSILWTSPAKMAENAALVGNEDSILILKDDGEIQILSTHLKQFSAVKTYNVSNTQTWAHPIPIASGLLIKNEEYLTLWNYGSASS